MSTIKWENYPKLAAIFEHRPEENVYWDELHALLAADRAKEREAEEQRLSVWLDDLEKLYEADPSQRLGRVTRQMRNRWLELLSQGIRETPK